MIPVGKAGAVACAALLMLAGCAASLEAEQEREQKAADIAAILEQPLAAELGETENCLPESRMRGFRALDDQHLLFNGTGGRYWVNTLRGRCADLRYSQTLVVRHFSGSQICDKDRFSVADWFGFRWYRRQPADWGSGVQCVLGEFRPVTPDQVAEIDAVLDRD